MRAGERKETRRGRDSTRQGQIRPRQGWKTQAKANSCTRARGKTTRLHTSFVFEARANRARHQPAHTAQQRALHSPRRGRSLTQAHPQTPMSHVHPAVSPAPNNPNALSASSAPIPPSLLPIPSPSIHPSIHPFPSSLYHFPIPSPCVIAQRRCGLAPRPIHRSSRR